MAGKTPDPALHLKVAVKRLRAQFDKLRPDDIGDGLRAAIQDVLIGVGAEPPSGLAVNCGLEHPMRALVEDLASQTCEHLGNKPDNGCLPCRARWVLGLDRQEKSFREALNEPTTLRKIMPPEPGILRVVKCPECEHERKSSFRVNKDFDALPQCGPCPVCGCRRIIVKE